LLTLIVGALMVSALVIVAGLDTIVVLGVLLGCRRFGRRLVVVMDDCGACQAAKKERGGDQKQSQVPDSVQEGSYHVTTLFPTSGSGSMVDRRFKISP
jgi:hypothetical protein